MTDETNEIELPNEVVISEIDEASISKTKKN